jgi:hypothetical protein
MGHFMASALAAFVAGDVASYSAGLGMEHLQNYVHTWYDVFDEDDPGFANSRWTPEDLPSDLTGAKFGASLKPGDNVAAKLHDFFKAAGAVSADSLQARRILGADVDEWKGERTYNVEESQEYKRKHKAWKCLCDGDHPKPGLGW